MDFPSETGMVAALVQAAMLDSLEKQVTIANVAGFKATVERRLYEGEQAHAGYIKLAYKAMARRRRGDPDDDLPNRPPPIDDVLDDEDHPVATPDQAARWQAIITRLQSLPTNHPARALARTRGHDDWTEEQALTFLEMLEHAIAGDPVTTITNAEEWTP